MSGATLEIEDLGGGEKRLTVDCPHGTILIHALNSAAIGDPAIIAGALIKHYSEEQCSCTAELRQKYPPSLLPKTLWVTP